MSITVPKHYGHGQQLWPPGEYWLVEHRGASTLFWCDALDSSNRTGWSHVPQFAAGFATEAEARDAFAQRGKTVREGAEIRYVLHVWE